MTASYRLLEDEDGPSVPRISAVDAQDIEIAGAYERRGTWLLYTTTTLTDVAEVRMLADHLHLFSRDEARQWVDLIAHLYCKALGDAA